jgi:hypothetical protein
METSTISSTPIRNAQSSLTMMLPEAGVEVTGADTATGVGAAGMGAAAGAAAATEEGDAAELLACAPQPEQNCAPAERGSPQFVQNAMAYSSKLPATRRKT